MKKHHTVFVKIPEYLSNYVATQYQLLESKTEQVRLDHPFGLFSLPSFCWVIVSGGDRISQLLTCSFSLSYPELGKATSSLCN